MIEWIKKERDYLLGINDLDALKLSASERYQRNKYLGEIESAKMLEETRRKLALLPPSTRPIKKRYQGKFKQSDHNSQG
jgi:hypothetical protein